MVLINTSIDDLDHSAPLRGGIVLTLDKNPVEEEGITNCSGSRKDPDCWKVAPGRFISDTDVYMEFDDRWTHRANMVDTNDEYEQTGYPLGLRVMAEAHSYGVSYAEDIMFVTVRVRFGVKVGVGI